MPASPSPTSLEAQLGELTDLHRLRSLAERALESLFTGLDVALERDFGRRRNQQIGAHGLDHLGSLAAQQARERIL